MRRSWIPILHSLLLVAAATLVSAVDPAPAGAVVIASVDVESLVAASDADTSPGFLTTAGTGLPWTFVVTNTGEVTLTSVVVTDSGGLTVTCPKIVLEPEESMTCSSGSTAVAGVHGSTATVTADAEGLTVMDADPTWYYTPVVAGAWLVMSVNGQEARNVPPVTVSVGTTLSWAFSVTNIGAEPLSSVEVTAPPLSPTCPKTVLEPAESMTCTASSVAEYALHNLWGTVTGESVSEGQVYAGDHVVYFGEAHPSAALETRVNGQDADVAPGPQVLTGSTLGWTFVVANTGDMPLTSVSVVNDAGLAVSCPKAALQPGEAMTCTAASAALAGPRALLGTVTGTWHESNTVSDHDSAFYLGVSPEVAIETLVNGTDADAAPGPAILAGTPLGWTHVVTNTGQVALTTVVVTDDQGLAVTCPKTTLAAGESMTCTASSAAVLGLHGSVGSVTAGSAVGGSASDSDQAWYTGLTEGCSPGYWKSHTRDWPPTGYSPGQTVGTVFSEASRYPPVASATLRQALGFKGGQGVLGAARTLVRAGTAALLDAAYPGLDFPRTEADVIAAVNTALASGDRPAMLALATQLNLENGGFCLLG